MFGKLLHFFLSILFFCNLIHLINPSLVLYTRFRYFGSVILKYPSILLFVRGICGSLKYVVVRSNFLLRFFRNFCVSSSNCSNWLYMVLNLLFASFCESTSYMLDILSSMFFCSLSSFLFCFSSFLSLLFSEFRFFLLRMFLFHFLSFFPGGPCFPLLYFFNSSIFSSLSFRVFFIVFILFSSFLIFLNDGVRLFFMMWNMQSWWFMHIFSIIPGYAE